MYNYARLIIFVKKKLKIIKKKVENCVNLSVKVFNQKLNHVWQLETKMLRDSNPTIEVPAKLSLIAL